MKRNHKRKKKENVQHKKRRDTEDQGIRYIPPFLIGLREKLRDKSISQCNTGREPKIDWEMKLQLHQGRGNRTSNIQVQRDRCLFLSAFLSSRFGVCLSSVHTPFSTLLNAEWL